MVHVFWKTAHKDKVCKPFPTSTGKTVSHLHEVEVKLCYLVIIIRSVCDKSYGPTIQTMLLQPNIHF